jgi:DNA-binding transcriptional MerR regulator
MISEASKRVDVEAHVLRYWQKQLGLPISRNEMEQRYYKEADVELFKKVKVLKERGFQLKAIKMLLSNLDKPEQLDTEAELLLGEKLDGREQDMQQEDKQPVNESGTSLIAENEQSEIADEPNTKMNQFKAVLSHIVMEALKENNVILSKDISSNVTGGMIKEMNYLMRIQEEKEEERYRKFDATLRDYQKSRMMTAATSDHHKKRSKFFKKNHAFI